MKASKRRYAVMIAVIAAVAAAVLIGIQLYSAHRSASSALHRAVSSYMDGSAEWVAPASGGEGERTFAAGMDAYIQGSYGEAQALFAQALESDHSDPALPAYANYYINRCVYDEYGTGQLETVTAALDAMAEYPPLASDSDIIWEMVSTITTVGSEVNGYGDNGRAAAMLNDYLLAVDDIDVEAWAHIKNCIASLQYINQEYAPSIRGFYDVEQELQSQGELPDRLARELRFAQEYIANIHYIYEDYEDTILLYQQLAGSLGESELDEAYIYYINMSAAYLELSDIENARGAAMKLADVLPLLEEPSRSEVEASMHELLAGIAIEEGDLPKADRHLTAAEELFSRTNNDVLYNGSDHITLTRCDYLIRAGQYDQAQSILEGIIHNNDNVFHENEAEIYELLASVYWLTEQPDALAHAYEQLLELDDQFQQTTQREYLEFSEYYQEVKRLEIANQQLHRTNMLTLTAALVIAAVLVAVLLVVKRLRRKNVIDPLTGVFNRKKLALISSELKRSGTPASFGVVMMDIDFFKRYNDTYGHPAGDEALRQVADVLKSSLRKNDTVIRYGGEEFLVLLGSVPADMAEEVCRRILRRLEERAIPHCASDAAPHLTLSIGLCHQETANAAALDQLIAYADECLYAAKEGGRNRVSAKMLG